MPEKKKPAEKPISLHPLKFEEALSDLLRVKSNKSDKPKVVRRSASAADKK